jgi:hypothetical protein
MRRRILALVNVALIRWWRDSFKWGGFFGGAPRMTPQAEAERAEARMFGTHVDE